MKGININTNRIIYKYPLDSNGNAINEFTAAYINTPIFINSVLIGDKYIMQNGELVGLAIPVGNKRGGFIGSPMSTGGIFSIVQIKKIISVSDTQAYIEYFILYTNN